MPEEKTIERAQEAKQEGTSPSTQAGEFVHEEIEKICQGEHGARSAKQAIAIGLNEARRAGVKLKPPQKGTVSEKTRRVLNIPMKRDKNMNLFPKHDHAQE